MNRPGRALLLLVWLPACAGGERAEVRPPEPGTLPELGTAGPPYPSDQPSPGQPSRDSVYPPVPAVPQGPDVREVLRDALYAPADLDGVVSLVHPEAVRGAVKAVYGRSEGRWIWSERLDILPAARRLIRIVERIQDHGLSPHLVRASFVGGLVRALDWNAGLLAESRWTEPQVPSLVRARVLLLGELDAQLTGTALTLARVLGRSDAGGEALALVLPPAGQLERWVADLTPWHPQYGRLLAAMARYRRYAAGAAWPVVPVPEGPTGELAVGQKSEAVATLRERLHAEGLVTGAPVGPRNVLDRALAADLGSFQYSRGLAASGRLDKATVAALNVKPEELVRRIRDGLFAWRRSEARGETTFLKVNLPEYMAELYIDGKLRRRHRVVIGYPFKSGGGRTKQFHAEVSEVVLNPGWTPSDGILEDELLPKEHAQPGFLRRKGFHWFTRPDGRKGVYQLPGDWNSLGRAAIRFPNPNNIYLHGSPGEEQFQNAYRAASHGCVRVQDIEDLATEILQWDGRMTRSQVEDAIAASRTQEVRLEKRLPIHFEYVLAVVDDDGTVRFLPNVYRM